MRHDGRSAESLGNLVSLYCDILSVHEGSSCLTDSASVWGSTCGGVFKFPDHSRIPRRQGSSEVLQVHVTSPTSSFVSKHHLLSSVQELCRQRMAIRTSERVERPETLRHSRLNSVSSQFSDGPAASPSTRSSTSSWCEEPVPSNMDISTGHMILVRSFLNT